MVQARLKGEIKNAQAEIDAKAKERRETMRKNELEAKADLEKRIEKARQRPMLVDSYNDKRHKNLAMMKAMKDVMQTYKDSGIPES